MAGAVAQTFFSGFAAISAVIPLTSSRFSRLCLGGLLENTHGFGGWLAS